LNNDGYEMARVKFNSESQEYSFEKVDWPILEEDTKHVIRDTKPHTLRSVQSKATTYNGKLVILHDLCCKDDSQST